MDRKIKVLLVLDLAPSGDVPRRIVSVVDLTSLEAARLTRKIDLRQKAGELKACFMAPIDTVERTFRQTLSLL